MAKDPNRGTELGGVAGLIQPAPHEPTPSETLMQIYATEPAPPREGETIDDFIPTTSRRR